MARAPSHSPQREISPGSTPLPSFIGRHQRTSSSRYLMRTIYIATCAAIVFTLTRWNRTHMTGHILQLPCLMQITLNTTQQHAATPRLRADAEEPERPPVVLQRPSQPHLATALVYTIERHSRTHKAVSNNHIIVLSRNTYSAREQSTAINLLNEKEERK